MSGDPRRLLVQVELDEDAYIVVPEELGVVLRCRSGSLWVAQLGKFEDLAMTAGDEAVLHKGSHSIVRAVQASVVELCLSQRQRNLLLDLGVHDYELRRAGARHGLKLKGKYRIALAGDQHAAASCQEAARVKLAAATAR